MKNFNLPPNTISAQPEVEKKPRYRLMITRHAERLPDGSASPAGVESSKKKGGKLKDDAEVVKGYASDEKTKRTVVTSDLISETAETISPETNTGYKTRERKGIQYSILEPDLSHLLKQAKKIIDQATIKELGLPADTVLANLSKEEQERIAPIRQKNQELGFKSWLDSPEGVHRLSIGLAHQLSDQLDLVNRYSRYRQKTPPKKDVILNTVGHGMFSESLFMEAGYIKNERGELRKITKDDFEDPEFGGFIMPTESWFLEIGENPAIVPDKIPVSFEREGRPKGGEVFIDKNELIKLAEEYEERREGRE